jgi:copper homeostasis protein (lipoprotein)
MFPSRLHLELAKAAAMLAGALLLGAANAAAAPQRPAGSDPPPPHAPAPADTTTTGLAGLGPLPATFGGVLPCADCTGIRQTLDLFAEGDFHWRSVLLGKPPGEAPDDVGRWMFASDNRTLLLFGSRDAPVRLVLRDDGALRLLDLEGRPIQSTFNYELRRAPGAFTPFEPRATLRGIYLYFADAPVFTDCATGRLMPVAPGDAALALERAYTAARQPPAAPRLVVVEGRIAQRPPIEGPGPRATLVVEKFLRLADAGATCPMPPVNAPLPDTRWRLTRLAGAPAASARRLEAWLQFDAAGSRVTGSGGCNTVAGAYALDGERLRFSRVTGTMRSCPGIPERERAFVAMLGKVQRWLVAGAVLELLDADGRRLASFEAPVPAHSAQP